MPALRGGVRVAAAAAFLPFVLYVTRADAGEAAKPQRYLAYVALENARSVAVLAGPPWRVRERIPVAAGPHNVTASDDGRFVAVSSPPGGAVTLFDGRHGKAIRSARVPGSPHDLVFTADGGALWVTAEKARRVIELAVPSGLRLRSVPTTGAPHDLALDCRGRLWVTIDGSSHVDVRSAATGRLLVRPDLGSAPHDVAEAPGGQALWFSNWRSGSLTVVDERSRRVVGRVAAGREPHHFAFGLGRLWVTDNAGGSLVRVDPAARRVLGRTALGPAPHHPAVAGSFVLVAVHGNGDVAIVSRSGRLLRELPVGPGPHGIAVVRVRRG